MRKFILLLSRWNKFPKESLDYQRARLVHVILVLMIIGLTTISFLDVLTFHDSRAAIIDVSGLILACTAYIYFHKTLNIKHSAQVTVYLFTLFTLGAVIFQAPDYHVVIWMCAVPPVAFYLMGVKRGYLISIAFAVILEIYFIIQGFHSKGPEDVMNITMAYAGIVIFIAYFEKSREEAFSMLLKDIDRRKKVEQQIQLLNSELEQKVVQRTRQLQEMNDLLNEEILVRRKAEEVSNNARQAALEANRVKSEFLSRMSHKLRTPLNSILGFSQVLEMSKLDDRQLKNLHHIHNGGKELLRLIDDILEINTIDNLEVHVSPARFSLNDLIKASIQSQSRAIYEKNLRIKLIEDPAGDIFIQSDEKLLEKIIHYLLDNAVKFNRTDGEIRIQVKEINTKKCVGDCFKLSIYDTGIGILEHDQAKIFDMFLTGDTGSYDAENIGLGLTMAKKIVEKLGGTIGVESEHGTGSHFWVEIPVILSDAPAPEKPNGVPASQPLHRNTHSQHHASFVTNGKNM